MAADLEQHRLHHPAPGVRQRRPPLDRLPRWCVILLRHRSVRDCVPQLRPPTLSPPLAASPAVRDLCSAGIRTPTRTVRLALSHSAMGSLPGGFFITYYHGTYASNVLAYSTRIYFMCDTTTGSPSLEHITTRTTSSVAAVCLTPRTAFLQAHISWNTPLACPTN